MSLACAEQPLWKENAVSPAHAVLLLHGLGGGEYEMEPLSLCLQKLGYSVSCPVYPGHEISHHCAYFWQPHFWMQSSTWPQWFHAARHQYERLQERYPKITIIGFSTGCLMAMRLAQHYPVHQLILINPFMAIKHRRIYGFRPEVYVRRLGKFLRHVPRRGLAIQHPGQYAKKLKTKRHVKTIYVPCVSSALELIDLVGEQVTHLTTPTCIIQSWHDSVVDQEGAERLMALLPSVDKRFFWIKDSDHCLLLDRGCDETLEIVKRFISMERLGQ
jgi:carboxylesterase